MSKPDPAQPVYRITLRARPDRVPAAKRLAQLLKHALRCLGLVCTEAIEVRPDGNESVPTPDGPKPVGEIVPR